MLKIHTMEAAIFNVVLLNDVLRHVVVTSQITYLSRVQLAYAVQAQNLITNNTVELQWLEHPWDYENLFETGAVGAIDG